MCQSSASCNLTIVRSPTAAPPTAKRSDECDWRTSGARWTIGVRDGATLVPHTRTIRQRGGATIPRPPNPPSLALPCERRMMESVYGTLRRAIACSRATTTTHIRRGYHGGAVACRASVRLCEKIYVSASERAAVPTATRLAT